MSMFDAMLKRFSRFVFSHCSLGLEMSGSILFSGIPGMQFCHRGGGRLKANQDSTISGTFNGREESELSCRLKRESWRVKLAISQAKGRYLWLLGGIIFLPVFLLVVVADSSLRGDSSSKYFFRALIEVKQQTMMILLPLLNLSTPNFVYDQHKPCIQVEHLIWSFYF